MKVLHRFKRRSAKVLFGCLVLFLAFAKANAGDPYGKPANLHLVSVGIAVVPNHSPIPSCKKDAEDMVRWAQSQKGKLFANVHTSMLLEQQATGANILEALNRLKATAKKEDYSIVYLSSHGGCGANGEFGLAAYDRSLRSSEIQQALRDVPGTVIVIIDACHCGGVKGDNLIVLSASLKSQSSCGFGSYNKNSLFTEFLLEGLEGAADVNGDGIVTMSEVETYVSNKLVLANQSKEVSKHQTMTITRPGNVPSALPLAKLKARTAQQPTAPVATLKLTGTTWTGSEKLGGGYDKLTFRFLADGKAVMIDAKNTVAGTWKLEGNRLVIDFPRTCSYAGEINGTTITGNGRDATRTWNFTVTQVKN